jgi:IS30 family transposase
VHQSKFEDERLVWVVGSRSAPSTVSREVSRNGGTERYWAARSDQAAWDRARRPKLCKLACHPFLRRTVSIGLRRQWSPEQIAGCSQAHISGGNHNIRCHTRRSTAAAMKLERIGVEHLSNKIYRIESRFWRYTRSCDFAAANLEFETMVKKNRIWNGSPTK